MSFEFCNFVFLVITNKRKQKLLVELEVNLLFVVTRIYLKIYSKKYLFIIPRMLHQLQPSPAYLFLRVANDFIFFITITQKRCPMTVGGMKTLFIFG